VLSWNPWAGLALLIGGQMALLVVLRELKHRRGLHPEVSRKAAHVALGLSMLACPILFAEPWPIAVLSGAALFVIAVMRWLPAIKSKFGGVVGGVARGSGGDLYFPLSALLLYWITDGDLILFGVPILILTVADALAAVIGVFYGRTKLVGADKTVEGSLAFFLAAFFATHVPLLLASDAPRGASLMIALIIGILVMLLEAVSLYGSDNMFIPIGGYLLLKQFVGMSIARLSVTLLVVVSLMALVLFFRRGRSLNDAALLAAVLVGFVAWSVGGWQWLVPPLVFFLTSAKLWPRKAHLRDKPHDVSTVMSVSSAGLLWLLLFVQYDARNLYYHYTLAFAAHLVFVGITWHRFMRPGRHPVVAVGTSVVAAWIVMFAPFVLTRWFESGDALYLAATAPVWLTLGGIAFTLLVRWGTSRSEETYPWVRQAVIGGVASMSPDVIVPVLMMVGGHG
jgi:phytol kinase